MTTDDWRLWVAVIALAQPWLIDLYKRFFRAGSIEIYQAGRVDIGFSELGPTIGIQGTLRAVHRDLFVTRIEVVVERLKDHSRHVFTWGAFRSINTAAQSGEIPAAFLLSETSPRRFNIIFHATQVQEEIREIQAALRTKWQAAADQSGVTTYVQELLSTGKPEAGPSIASAREQHYETVGHEPDGLAAYTKIQKLCFWDAGDYRVTITTVASHPEQTSVSFTIKITEGESAKLQRNAVLIHRAAADLYSGVYNFAYPKPS